MSDLTIRERVQVLAALRSWQEAGIDGSGMPHFEDAEPLSLDEIDLLCEKLNCDSGQPESFLCELEKADAVEIDDYFIRYFHHDFAEAKQAADELVLEASICDEDGDMHEYEVSLIEAQTATYNTHDKSWNVGKYTIKLIEFRK